MIYIHFISWRFLISPQIAIVRIEYDLTHQNTASGLYTQPVHSTSSGAASN
jgi:hypothetical protein